MRRKAGYDRALGFVQEVLPALHLAAADDSMRQEALEVFRRFARDKKLSFCDCLSYVVITTILEGVSTATFDRHFRALGLPVVE